VNLSLSPTQAVFFLLSPFSERRSALDSLPQSFFFFDPFRSRLFFFFFSPAPTPSSGSSRSGGFQLCSPFSQLSASGNFFVTLLPFNIGPFFFFFFRVSHFYLPSFFPD